jgi:hypothetical protein
MSSWPFGHLHWPLMHRWPSLQSPSPQQPFAAQQTRAPVLHLPVVQSLPDEQGPWPGPFLHSALPSATHWPASLQVWWVVLFWPVHLSIGGQHSKLLMEQPPKVPPEQRRSPSRPQLFRQVMVLPSQQRCPGPLPQGTAHLPLPWQARLPVQPGWAILQQSWPSVPQVAHAPPMDSVLPVQQAPEAQPRAHGVLFTALPSGRHSFRVEPSQVAG